MAKKNERTVDADGYVSFRNKKYLVGSDSVGEKVTLTEPDKNGIVAVTFAGGGVIALAPGVVYPKPQETPDEAPVEPALGLAEDEAPEEAETDEQPVEAPAAPTSLEDEVDAEVAEVKKRTGAAKKAAEKSPKIPADKQITVDGGKTVLANLTPLAKMYNADNRLPDGRITLTGKLLAGPNGLLAQTIVRAETHGLLVAIIGGRPKVLTWEDDGTAQLFDGSHRLPVGEKSLDDVTVITTRVFEYVLDQTDKAVGRRGCQIFVDKGEVRMTGYNNTGRPVILTGFANRCKQGITFDVRSSRFVERE